MYGLHNSLLANEGQGDALADILVQASKMMTSSISCHAYIVSRSKANPDQIWVTEVWDSKESHDASLQDPEVRSLIARAMPILKEMPQPGQELDVVHL